MDGDNAVTLDGNYTVKDFKEWLEEMPEDGKIMDITTGTLKDPEGSMINITIKYREEVIEYSIG